LGCPKPGFLDPPNSPPPGPKPPKIRVQKVDPGGQNIGPRGVHDLGPRVPNPDPQVQKARPPGSDFMRPSGGLKPQGFDLLPRVRSANLRISPQKSEISSSARREEFKFLNSPHMKWGSLRRRPNISILACFAASWPDSYSKGIGIRSGDCPAREIYRSSTYPPPLMTDDYPIGDWSFGGPEATNTRMVCDMARSEKTQRTAHKLTHKQVRLPLVMALKHVFGADNPRIGSLWSSAKVRRLVPQNSTIDQADRDFWARRRRPLS